ncbi:MAG: glycoside hydrolase family 66 protein [Mediterranea sp.]|jgi:dextranase|nr:glycoside hydrolase family 66 protein [Mediterranea sp.]
MKKIFYHSLFSLLLPLLIACGGGDDPGNGGGNGGGGGTGGGADGEVTNVVNVTSDLTVDLSTDKACYRPGETVRFVATGTLPAGAKVRYRTLDAVVAEQDATSDSWTWTAPAADFTGYLVDIYREKDANTEVVLGTIAVDVSSDWTRFPRYGFVATFDQTKTDEVIGQEMDFLNRCHINGVQFQDWHNKHHWPLGGTRDRLDDVYKDIANRDIYTRVVKGYIDAQHQRGMKAMFYNLCFGALSDAATDGVNEQWYIFKGTGHTDKDSHNLPSGWKSNIYLLDPANTEWQQYIAQRNDDVYANIDFDGYQIDQLGNRGDRYDYNGNKVNLPKGYASFIDAMKRKHPDKRLVMNAVSSYGASQIAGTGKVDFLYNELWDSEAAFADLHTVVKANDQYSGHTLRTVFAAYMNYNRSSGEFNTPGVLLTDAVMFALGGAHLELGDHMLCKEYFPNNSLAMNGALRTAIVRYYDFHTAYQQLLRGTDTSSEVSVAPTCTDATKRIDINAWPPKRSAVTCYARQVDGKTVMHLLNFRDADQLSWRDMDGTMPVPQLLSNIPLSLSLATPVKKVWVATPDFHAGASQELAFEQKEGTLTFTLPFLRYWTMIVIE